MSILFQIAVSKRESIKMKTYCISDTAGRYEQPITIDTLKEMV